MSIPFCIHCTLPESHCICSDAPNLTHPYSISVLFHPRELERRNSTGRLLKHCCHISSYKWHRLKNNQQANFFQNFALVYPETDTKNHQPLPSNIEGFLWIDSTWQESQKMLRQSPWLNALPKYPLSSEPSQYKLRRNQKQTGLSTMESMAIWLQQQKQPKAGQDLLHFFNLFQDRYLAAREAGMFK